MPSKKFQKLLYLAHLRELDTRGMNGNFHISQKDLDRRLNTDKPVTFEGQTYYLVDTQPHFRRKEG